MEVNWSIFLVQAAICLIQQGKLVQFLSFAVKARLAKQGNYIIGAGVIINYQVKYHA